MPFVKRCCAQLPADVSEFAVQRRCAVLAETSVRRERRGRNQIGQRTLTSPARAHGRMQGLEDPIASSPDYTGETNGRRYRVPSLLLSEQAFSDQGNDAS